MKKYFIQRNIFKTGSEYQDMNFPLAINNDSGCTKKEDLL
jgi:hypothetical protein